MKAFRLFSRSSSITGMCYSKSKRHPMLHGENVLSHILFTQALCDNLPCASAEASGFLGGPASYEYRLYSPGVTTVYRPFR